MANGDYEATPSNGLPSEAIVEGPTELPNWKSNGTVELVNLIVLQGTHTVVSNYTTWEIMRENRGQGC